MRQVGAEVEVGRADPKTGCDLWPQMNATVGVTGRRPVAYWATWQP
jgi:hypothetical protein